MAAGVSSGKEMFAEAGEDRLCLLLLCGVYENQVSFPYKEAFEIKIFRTFLFLYI